MQECARALHHGAIAARSRTFLRPRRRGFSPVSVNPVSEINWKTELRKIVREYDGLPPEPPSRPRRSSKTEFRLERIQEIAAKYAFYDRLAVYGEWARLALAGVLTLSLFAWPYGRDCGFGLAAFFVSNIIAVGVGLSFTMRAWRERAVVLFIAASLVVLVAWSLIAVHALPRLGYSALGSSIVGWSCP
jgi:hypothetical protein